jgi:hypothetical protein
MGKGWSLSFVFLAAALCSSCTSNPAGPVRTMENGIEVVDDGAGIYSVPGQPSSLSLREEFRIDLESEALAEAGLNDIVAIDADSRGRIYLFRSMRTQGPLIFQFDQNGSLLRSFGAMGQGPGEAQYPAFLGITKKDEVWVKSQSPDRLLVFGSEGRLVRESRIVFDPFARPNLAEPLENGNYLARYVSFDGNPSSIKSFVALFGPDFKKISDLREYGVPDMKAPIGDVLAMSPIYCVSSSSFFVNWGSRGRDVGVFDLKGRMKRIIRAAFRSVPVPPAYMKTLLDRVSAMNASPQTREYLLSFKELPVFQSFFSDEKGHLFVAGCEKDPKTGANICDIFSPEGIRFARAAVGFQDHIRYSMEGIPFDVVLKNGRAYCVREKPSGFKEVIVSSLIWR